MPVTVLALDRKGRGFEMLPKVRHGDWLQTGSLRGAVQSYGLVDPETHKIRRASRTRALASERPCVLLGGGSFKETAWVLLEGCQSIPPPLHPRPRKEVAS